MTRCTICLLALCLVLLSTASVGQHAQVLAQSERAFAHRAVETNVRDAFLTFFNNETVAFSQGKAVNGRKQWESRSPSNNYLFWWPIISFVAASGDIGYTTGPAVYGPNRTTREITGGIYYSSVWRKDSKGEWKVLVDIGSSIYDPARPDTTFRPIEASHLETIQMRNGSIKPTQLDSLLHRSLHSTDHAWLAADARIYRPGRKPVDPGHFKEDGEQYVFVPVGDGVSSSGDFAYTYGEVRRTIDGKTENLNYLRIWRRLPQGWRMVLDVIG